MQMFAQGKLLRGEPAVKLIPALVKKLLDSCGPSEVYSYMALVSVAGVLDVWHFYYCPGAFEPQVDNFLRGASLTSLLECPRM